MKYTYKKSDGEDIWTVGHDDNGEWIPESDWDDALYAKWRVAFLGNELCGEDMFLATLRKRIEEMHEGYRMGQVDIDPADYYRGAADACWLILDLPELRLFLPAKDGGE